MEITQVRALRGPNLWSRKPSIEALVECNGNEQSPERLAGFDARLRERLPALASWLPENGNGPASCAHALEIVTLTLQVQAGCPVSFSRTAPTTTPRLYRVVVEYTEEAVGHLASAIRLDPTARSAIAIAHAVNRPASTSIWCHSTR